MKNIVLYAPPAAGKGEQCDLLSKKFGYKVLSVGQLLRNARSSSTEVGREIIKAQDQGLLVPDSITLGLIESELQSLKDCPLIIDGYPRNISQAKSLDKLLSNYIVLNLFVDRTTAMKRSLGRLNCKNCNKGYNKYFDDFKPKTEGICDVCGSKLDSRSDDNEDTFNRRYDVYENNQEEILNFYKEKNILYIIDATSNIQKVSNDIDEVLNKQND